jgi:hypothetical protein
MRSLIRLNALALIVLGLAGCNLPQSEPALELATPVSQSPAAGICAAVEDPVVTMTIRPDVPDPRCLQVQPAQRLRVVNQSGQVQAVQLGGEGAEVAPEADYIFEHSFGQLLLAGVHPLLVSTCCGGEIWLKSQ